MEDKEKQDKKQQDKKQQDIKQQDKKHPVNDPHARREAEKYARPIASREYIIEFLTESGRPITLEKLGATLHLEHDDEWEGLRRRLIAMLRDGQLMRNRRGSYALVQKMDLIPGRIQAHKDGYGFLIPDTEGDDLFLSARQMRAVMHGDRVLARISGVDQRGRKEGVIVEVTERNTETLVGRLMEEEGISFVAPSSKNFSQDVMVAPDKKHGAVPGQIVLIKIIAQPSERRQAMGEVLEILGEHMDPGMEIDVALLAYKVPYKWPEAVLDEVSKLKPEVTEDAKQNREDVRALTLLTIDGEDAKDFDDAVYCESHPQGWRLLVAIADVSHYVNVDTALDEEATRRGNSVYFPGRVIPMLPEILSNGLCSLNPHVDRLCMVCDMVIDHNGNILTYRFYDSVMNSRARMTYNKVEAILKGDAKLRAEYTAVVPQLENLYKLYHVLRKGREVRGALDFDTIETQIIFGENKKIEKIVRTVRNEAHMLIEECMLAANVCAARFLEKQKLPGLYRVHERPREEKIKELRDYLAMHGLSLGGGDMPHSKDFQNLLLELKKRDDIDGAQTVVLRSLNQAVYSPENAGHFGLAYTEYGHFTSPIRRYPDLLLHRAIRHFLRGGTPQDFTYTAAAMQQLGEHCSMTERRADDATRDVVSWLKCEFMSHHVGEEYAGKITGVTAFGLFVQLDEVFVEGLVHVTSLKNDYYHFDAGKHRLVGERTGTKYSLGEKLKVLVSRVDIDQRKIDFELVDNE
ncbi:MAG: ribonuclease R [Gammaproteobacteria bacterium]|nr:ribonuclease R [Gammaproteobacteria bacterium]